MIWYKNSLCKKWMGTWTCTILTKRICNAIQWHTHKAQHSVAQFGHDCVKGYQDIFIFYTFQLVYIYWLYKVVYIYMNIKCKNKNTYSEGMALLYSCACVWDSIHVQYGRMDRLSHTEYGLDWINVIWNLTLSSTSTNMQFNIIRLFVIHLSLCKIQIQLIWTAEKMS